ncbi:MAG: ERCC4 domain-containing protein [Candidatus Anstonellaceae archaeon]
MWLNMEQKPKIIVDSNEPKLYVELLQSLGAQVEQKKLDVGDFILSQRVVVERKTKSDFVSSIIDQRAFTQAKDMENWPIAIFVIEEDGSKARITENALYGAYGCLLTDFKMTLFFSRGPKETSQLLYSIARYEQISRKFEFRANPKKNTKTISLNQLSIVESLPGVGQKTAKKLLEVFKSPMNIFFATEKQLEGVEFIGPQKAKQIREVLDSYYK